MNISAPKKHTILVVEDDELLRRAMSFELEQEGFSVLRAAQGKEAWDLLQTHQNVDLILTDIIMPEMGGIELMAKIKESLAISPAIVVYSAYKDISYEEAISLGAREVISKPSDSNTILEKIRQTLANR